jgi:CHASE3 domain sensor protein
MREGTYTNTNEKLVSKLEQIEKTIKNKPEYAYDINALSDLITERIKKGNTITTNHYKRGGLC